MLTPVPGGVSTPGVPTPLSGVLTPLSDVLTPLSGVLTPPKPEKSHVDQNIPTCVT